MSTRDGCGCKVGRTIEAFDLDRVNEELAARRTRESGRPASYRDLTDYFNREVVRSALERAGRQPLEGEVEDVYHHLTDDGVSSGMRIQVRRQLDGEGVDLEGLERSFVSHPTMGNHLKNCLGVERPRTSKDRVQTARERIFKMRGRVEAVIENTLDGLASAGRIPAGTLAITVDAQVTCQECGTHIDIGSFLERGGCDCEQGTDG